MQIDLPYGKEYLKLSLPDEQVERVLTSRLEQAPVLDGEAAVREALAHPIGSAPLALLARSKKNVVVIISDHTRPVPSRVILPAMLEQVRAGNPGADITLLVATGCHRAPTAGELREKLGDAIFEREKIVVHDAEDASAMVKIGRLPSGGSLWINRVAAQADLLLAEGFIEPHFFAGFSGGRKSVLPGVAARQSVHFNHCAPMIDHPLARCGVTQGNPIHEDMLSAARQANLSFIVNVVINAKKQVVGAFAGDVEQAHAAGCDFLRALAACPAAPADIVISTNNGYPLDQNLYQAVKGMSTAEATAAPGAVIIMVARCEDGHGGESFLATFRDNPSAGDILKSIRAVAPEDTIVDQWQSQILARILEKHTVIMLSQADDETVRQLHMLPAHSLEQALKIAREMKGAAARITVVPEGVSTIIR